jgi:hypothetical protein
MLQLFLHPYSSGVAFVRDTYQAEGWDGVDDLYANPPESTEQVIHPAKYPDQEPANLTVTDRSSDEWQPVTGPDGEQVSQSVGEAGLFISLWYPSFQTQGLAARNTNLVPLRAHINVDPQTGELAQPVSYSYENASSAGWAGDRLVPYVPTGDGNATLVQTGYVYETRWDSPAEAEEFVAAYRDLLAHHDAEGVSAQAEVYQLPENSGFADAVAVNQTGRMVRIVNAPTVDALSEIRAGAAPGAATTGTDDGDDSSGTDGPDETATPDGTVTATETPDSDEGDDSSGAIGPGFGVAVVALAVVLAGVLLARAR